MTVLYTSMALLAMWFNRHDRHGLLVASIMFAGLVAAVGFSIWIPRPDIAAAREAMINHYQAHYSMMGLSSGKTHKLHKPIIVNGKRYDSAMSASHETGIGEQTLRECANGYRTYSTFTAEWESR